MRHPALRLVPALLCAALAGSAAAQQQAQTVPQPRLGSVAPLGAKAGTGVDVRITGTDLDQAGRLLFSHPGIQSEALKSPPDRIFPQGRLTPNQFKVTVAANVPPGVYEVRAAGYFGVTNARRFVVGDAAESLEKEPNNETGQAMELAIGSVLNGACDAQNYDHVRIQAAKGQRIVAQAAAQRIDTRAMPVLTLIDPSGAEVTRVLATKYSDPVLDFTAETEGAWVVRVNDLLFRGGDEYGYRLTVTSGPWIDFADPPVLKTGAENAVTLYGRNLPGGQPSEFKVGGRPLEKLEVKIQGPADPASVHPAMEMLLRPSDASADLYAWRFESPQGRSNAVRFLLADEAPVREIEPNNDPDKAQAVKLPIDLVGRFEKQGDRDGVVFEAKKGERIWIEVFSQRLGLPTDPQVILQQVTKNEKGEVSVKDVQEADDQATPLPQMGNNMERRYRAHPEDPAILLAVPADGTYRVLVRDLYGSAQSDPRFFYRLEIRAARPDYRLVAFPVEPFRADNTAGATTCILRRGGADRVRVIAYRREGFDGEIRVEPESLPPGVTARAAVIPSGQTSAELLLRAAPDAPAFAGALRLVGRSGSVSRPVRSAEILSSAADMQRDALVTRLTDTFALAVDDRFTTPFSLQLGTQESYRMARGGILKIPVKLVKNADFKDADKAKVTVTVVGIPGRDNQRPITSKPLVLEAGKPEGELELDVTDKANLGPLSIYVAGDVDMPYVRNAEGLKQLQDEQKRIDGLGPELAAEAKKAGEAKQKAEQEAQQAAAALAKAKAAGQSEAAGLEEKVKAAEEARAKAAAEEAKVQDAVKQLDGLKKQFADDVKKMGDAAKEKRIKVWVGSLPVAIDVLASPVQVGAMPDWPMAKPGETTEIAVGVRREFGFADEVKLDVIPPSGVGLRLAQGATVPAGQVTGKMALVVDKNVKPGTYSAILRQSLKFNNRALTVDTPFPVTVTSP
jgi:hypothetical protein